MSTFAWGALVWGLWGLAFVPLELLAVKQKVPWPPLSDFTWSLDRFFVLLPWIVVAGLWYLSVHLSARFIPGLG